MKSFYFIITLSLSIIALTAYSQAGSLDPEFGGGDGKVTTSFFNEQHAWAYQSAVQPDGKILSIGFTGVDGGFDEVVLIRYMPDGSYDNTFNGNGKLFIQESNIHCYGRAILLQPDNKIVILVSMDADLDSIALYRFLPDGSPDNSFDVDGRVTTNLGTTYQGPKAMAMQPDGKILIGGYAGNYNEPFDKFFVARYKPDGKLDTSFDGDGVAMTTVGESWTNITTLLVQPDGKIIASGFATFNGSEDFALVRYNSNGTLDHSFSGDGIASASFTAGDDDATGAVLCPDGKILVGGFATPQSSNPEFAIARFTSDGILDNSFHGDGMNVIQVSTFADKAYSILLQPDGKILLGGFAHSNGEGGSDMALVRLNENGIPDYTFDGDGIAIYTTISESSNVILNLAFQPDGKIIASGFLYQDYYARMVVTRMISGIMVSASNANTPVLKVDLYPNPVTDNMVIEYELETKENLSISLYDTNGKLVETLLTKALRNPGSHTENLALQRALIPGVYVVSIESPHWKKSLQVLVE
jgi:uncharacterized delta-60 repeat protein